MKELLLKITKAKESIKNTKMQKKGNNSFSNYKYFTPDQVEKLVNDASSENSLLTKFDLVRNDLGIYGQLTIFDIESGNKLEYVMASDIPSIKATNIAQQLGGAVTYTERYIKMSAFGITENDLDFDTDKKQEPKKPELKQNTENWKACVKALQGSYTIADLQKKYTISQENINKLQEEAI